MIKGTFLTMWHWDKTRPYQDQFLEMLNVCNEQGITDLFVMVERRDKGTLIDHPFGFDHFQFLLDQPVRPRIHAWINALTLYRAQSKLDDGVPDSCMMSDGVVPSNLRDNDPDYGGKMERLYLNPTVKEAQEIIFDKLVNTCFAYNPDGLCIDKFRYPFNQSYFNGSFQQKQDALDDILESVRLALGSTFPISMTVRIHEAEKELNCCDYKRWVENGWINTLYPMLCEEDHIQIKRKIDFWRNEQMPTAWCVNCKTKTSYNLALSKLEGEDILFYSYPLWKQCLG